MNTPMAGYPVQRRRPPVIMREAARRRARDSGTLSGTSAEEEQMTGKIMPLRERDTSTIQAAADAFLSSPRYASPNTRRGYTGVLDRLLAGLGASRPPAPVLPASAERRREHLNATRAVPRPAIDRALTRRDVPLREKTLWRMLCATAARASEVLALNIEDP